ncbi:MAG: GGDEF and EAL domain-containing protein [Polyangiaceae bacterium]|nr:GGDEF and EAL domain-containing protein [Polyangiaceae bacterium]
MKPAALHRAQEHAAKWAAWIGVFGHVWAIVASLLKPTPPGFPATWTLVLAVLPTLAFAALIHRRVAFARHALVAYVGVLIPLLLTEPFVTGRPAVAILCPIALATFLTGPRTVLAMAIAPIVVVSARAGWSSPYLETGYLVMYLIISAMLFATRMTLNIALADAEKSSALFEALARETNEIITISGPGTTARDATVTYVSPSVTRVLGYPIDEPAQLTWADVVHLDDHEKITKISNEIRSSPGTSSTGQFRMRHKDGSYRWVVARGTNLVNNPHVGGVLSTYVDVTSLVEERELAEDRLEHEAHHDSATGLPNRRKLHDMLADALAGVKTGASWSVLFIDIDGFKVVNDSLGHDYGDRLITSVAERLVPVLPPASTIFRFGGDELVALLRTSGDEAGEIGARLVVAMQKPFALGERDVFVTASVGVAAVRPDHDRPEAVMKDADLAMYRAKERGRNRCERFDDKMRERAVRRHELEQALRCALDAGELTLAYQPKVSASDGRILGFEALARWDSARLGKIGPAEFVPLAEETGLIVPIGLAMLEKAGAQLRAWQARSPRLAGLKMAVNLSGRQLRGQEDFADHVCRILETNAVLPWCLELEITESVLMTNAAKAVERLERLKKLGVKLAIDDFGTGYSSLSYLRRFPVDVLKIDRAFVTGLGTSREDSAIVHLIITLAQALGLETVAEGVETHDQLVELRSLGCHQIQGFLISEPLSPEAATQLLERSYGLASDDRLRAAAE